MFSTKLNDKNIRQNLINHINNLLPFRNLMSLIETQSHRIYHHKKRHQGVKHRVTNHRPYHVSKSFPNSPNAFWPCPVNVYLV